MGSSQGAVEGSLNLSFHCFRKQDEIKKSLNEKIEALPTAARRRLEMDVGKELEVL